MVCTGFRDAQRDIPDPPPAQSAPDPSDEVYMDARPDQEEMEQAISKFLQLLEKQEKKGFKDQASEATPLLHLPEPAQGSSCSILWRRLWRLVFSQYWTKIRQICSPSWSCSCSDTLRTTGY